MRMQTVPVRRADGAARSCVHGTSHHATATTQYARQAAHLLIVNASSYIPPAILKKCVLHSPQCSNCSFTFCPNLLHARVGTIKGGRWMLHQRMK
jgi:hypothetical protein